MDKELQLKGKNDSEFISHLAERAGQLDHTVIQYKDILLRALGSSELETSQNASNVLKQVLRKGNHAQLVREMISTETSLVVEQVVFEYGMAHPESFYLILNDLALDPSTRLRSWMLLKTFLVLEGSPTYYLVESILFDSVVASALIDTEVSLFSTALTILTIMLPIVGIKATARLKSLMCILVQAVRWEQAYPRKLDGNWQNAFQAKDASEKQLLGTILDSIPRCVDQYFTVLYGMFPRFVLDNLFVEFTAPQSTLKKVADPLDGSMGQVQRQAVVSRMKQLLNSHRAHFALAGPATNASSATSASSPSADPNTVGPWFRTLEPSETIIECFQLKIESAIDSRTSENVDSNDLHSTLDVDSTDTITVLLKINSILHKNMDNPRLLPSDISLDKLYSIKAFYYILLNEAFFKECMRQYHMMHIRRLRKRLIEVSIQTSGHTVLCLTKESGQAIREKQMQALEERIQKDREQSVQSQLEAQKRQRELQSIIQEKDFQLENLTDEVSRQKSIIAGLEARITGLSSQQGQASMPEFQQDTQFSGLRPLHRPMLHS